jgi:hypothetical protein
MRLIAMKCSQCGAALPPRSRWSVIDCSYCHARMVLDGSSIVLRQEYRDALDRVESARASTRTARVGSVDYALAPEPLRGEHGDAYWGWRCAPLAEAVVIKVARAGEDGARLEREAATLAALQASEVRGSDHFSRLIPQVVAWGVMEGGPAGGRTALVLRRLSGFAETLADAAPQTRRDPRHGVWIWKRLLESLDWTHRAGWTHGAVTPRHALIHARDHGVMLTGWSSASRAASAADARGDLVMAARCVAFSLTGKLEEVGAELPAPLRALLAPWVAGDGTHTNAWALHEAVDAAARQAFGPPQYAPLKTAAWG